MNLAKKLRIQTSAMAFVMASIVVLSGCKNDNIQPGPAVDRSGKALESPQVAGLASSGEKPKPPAKGIVKLVRQGDSWQLLRDDQPYYVKGAGGEGDLALLAKSGANSTRTWGVDDKEETLRRLDEAEKNGLSVSVGIWLEHERHGMDYTEYDRSRRLKSTCR